MNKYFIIIVLVVIILAGGLLYRFALLPEEFRPVVTGEVRALTIVAVKDQWRFMPEIIEAKQGDKIILTVVNEDDYDHGLAIDAFGISQRMPALSTIKIEFIVTKAGEFPLYCSVPCGDGVVLGEKRTHFDMLGKLHVRSIISEAK
jgi:heme/copper-type cytochrome/quinol oxidase subunit 2